MTEAGKLAKVVHCFGEAGISVVTDIVNKLAGKLFSFKEVSVASALGGAIFTDKAKGSIAGKAFNISSSIGLNGFTQDGFKQLLHDPLAKLFKKYFKSTIKRG